MPAFLRRNHGFGGGRAIRVELNGAIGNAARISQRGKVFGIVEISKQIEGYRV
jgi:hypothetical protein